MALTLYQLEIKSHEYFIGIAEYLPNPPIQTETRLGYLAFFLVFKIWVILNTFFSFSFFWLILLFSLFISH